MVTGFNGCSPGNPRQQPPILLSSWKSKLQDRRKGKPGQPFVLRLSLQQNTTPKDGFTDEWLKTFQCLFIFSFQHLIISSFQQSTWEWDLTLYLLHGSERVTNDLYLEFFTVVGHYFKVTVSSLFHQAFHPTLSDFQGKHSLQSMILLWKN